MMWGDESSAPEAKIELPALTQRVSDRQPERSASQKMSHHSLLDSKDSSISDLPSVKGCACVSRAAHSGVSVNFDRVDGGVEPCKGLIVPWVYWRGVNYSQVPTGR